MAISWGSWVNNSSDNGMRVGIDLSQSPSSVGSGTSSVTVTAKFYVETKRSAYDSSNTFKIGGDFSWSGSADISHGSSGGTTLVRTMTKTVSTSYSGTVKVDASASLTGINAISGTASESTSHTVGRRPYSAPKAPTKVTTTRSGTSAKTMWTRNPTTAQPYDRIVVQRQVNGGSWGAAASLSGGTVQWTQAGLVPNSSYRFRVRAENSAGASAWVYGATVSMPPNAPAAPTGASVTRTSDNAQTVRWTNVAVANSLAPYEKVQVQRWDIVSNTWKTLATIGVLQGYTDRSTAANQQYRYRVRAENSGGASGYAYTNYMSTTPAAPTSLKATKKANSDITLTWSLAGVRKNSGIEVWLTQGGVDATARQILLPANTTTWTHTSPDTTKTWSYRLKTQAGADSNDDAPNLYSAFSARSNTVQLLTNPLAPTGLAPASVVRDGDQPLTLTWQHNEVDGTDQTAYEVQHRAQGETAWTTTDKVTSEASTFTLDGGTYANGQVVEWQVRTWGLYAVGNAYSPWSATAVITLSTPPSATILTPEDGTVLDTRTGTVTWAFSDPEGDAQAQWRATLLDAVGNTVETQTGAGATDTYTFASTLADGATYGMQVQVRDSTGLWSEPVQITATVEYPTPAPPTVTAQWDHDSGIVVVTISNPPEGEGEVPALYNELWRSIDGDEWVRIATMIPPDTTVTDYIPAVGTYNHYRAVAVSELPSQAQGAAATVDTTDHRWWVWVNAGPAFSTAIRIRDNAKVDETFGRAKTLRQFAGRQRPVEFTGEQRSRTLNLSGRFAPESSEPGEVLDLADLPAPACIRTPYGARYFVSTGEPAISRQGVTVELSWGFTQIDYDDEVDAGVPAEEDTEGGEDA